MKPNMNLLLAFLACLFFSLGAARGAELKNTALDFTLTIPDGFEPDADLTASNPDFVYAFRKPDPTTVGTVIIVERMHGTIGREHLKAAAMPHGFAGRIIQVPWESFTLDGIEVPETAGGVSLLTYNVQVPLKHEAIQLRVFGPGAQQAQLLALAYTLLGSLHGPSNWLASAAPAPIAESPFYSGMMLGVVIATLVLGLGALWIIRSHSPRGVVLGIALLLYISSWLVGPGVSREMRGAIGCTRMLGTLGILLGLVDLFWHPTRKKTNP